MFGCNLVGSVFTFLEPSELCAGVGSGEVYPTRGGYARRCGGGMLAATAVVLGMWCDWRHADAGVGIGMPALNHKL